MHSTLAYSIVIFSFQVNTHTHNLQIELTILENYCPPSHRCTQRKGSAKTTTSHQWTWVHLRREKYRLRVICSGSSQKEKRSCRKTAIEKPLDCVLVVLFRLMYTMLPVCCWLCRALYAKESTEKKKTTYRNFWKKYKVHLKDWWWLFAVDDAQEALCAPSNDDFVLLPYTLTPPHCALCRIPSWSFLLPFSSGFTTTIDLFLGSLLLLFLWVPPVCTRWQQLASYWDKLEQQQQQQHLPFPAVLGFLLWFFR